MSELLSEPETLALDIYINQPYKEVAGSAKPILLLPGCPWKNAITIPTCAGYLYYPPTILGTTIQVLLTNHKAVPFRTNNTKGD